MNKGRNILILLGCLLCVSILAFLTLFERSNSSGVVDNVRYVLESDDEKSGRTYSFYFVEQESVKAIAVDDMETWFITVEECPYTYTVVKGTGEVHAFLNGQEAGDEAYKLYTKEFFKVMFVGKNRLLYLWQALIVALICFAGGAIIMYAEEIWHIIKRTPEEVAVPKWSDMKGIKIAGGCVIGVGVVVLLLFVTL